MVNQATLKPDLEALKLQEKQCDFEISDKSHGRIKIRKIWVSTELNEYLNFPCMSHVFLY